MSDEQFEVFVAFVTAKVDHLREKMVNGHELSGRDVNNAENFARSLVV